MRHALVLAFVMFLSACGNGDVDKREQCTPSATLACQCGDGGDGTQTCKADATWGACSCEMSACSTDDDCSDGQTCSAGACVASDGDTDGDGVVDAEDNCPEDANADQADADGDGIGDACEVPGDGDGDGLLDAEDNCPEDSNPEQGDLDQDGLGDVCDDDRDGDEITNAMDNCPDFRNVSQADTNGDGIGDACDQDFDAIIDTRDNCPDRPNPGQEDLDGDEIGDECDLDDDGDLTLDQDDNCPVDANENQADQDGDGLGDVCDDDRDGDGRLNVDDNCPLIPNQLQQDRNQNGVGDACDDPDGDGVVDRDDNCPDEANPDQEDLDADGDQISDCDERALGTDPMNADSDGDGLSDLDELSVYRTDPTNADSDADGLEDGQELDLGLDPTNSSTFNDGVLDGDRDFVQACNSVTPGTATSYTNTSGGWRQVTPDEITPTTTLTITGATAGNGWAATLLASSTGDVSAFVAKYNALIDLDVEIDSLIVDPQARFFETAAGDEVVWSRNYAASSVAQPLDEYRNALLFQAVPWVVGDVTNMPAAQGASVTSVVGRVGIIQTAAGEVYVLGAVADPAIADDATYAVLDVLTDSTNLGPPAAMPVTGCKGWPTLASAPPLDLYWVLDQSGSMSDDFARLNSIVSSMFTELDNAHVDYRLGVTNMDEQIGGRLRASPGWMTDLTALVNEIDDFVVDCQGCGSTSGFAEWGVQGAIDGITYHTGNQTPASLAFRSDAKIVTIFMSDEETQSIQDNGLNTTTGQMKLDGFEAFFLQEDVTIYSYTGDGNACGLSDGQAYRYLAQVTGGFDTSLCSLSANTIAELGRAVAAAASPYVLSNVPATATLKVSVDGVEVPRSTSDGYQYYPEHNAIAFFGMARPMASSSVVVEYEQF